VRYQSIPAFNTTTDEKINANKHIWHAAEADRSG